MGKITEFVYSESFGEQEEQVLRRFELLLKVAISKRCYESQAHSLRQQAQISAKHQPSYSSTAMHQDHCNLTMCSDYQQYSLGSCDVRDIAGRVATRVTGHYPHRNQLLIDAGFLATSHDGANKLPHGASYGCFDNEPNLK